MNFRKKHGPGGHSLIRVGLLDGRVVEDAALLGAPHVLLVLDQVLKTLGGGERIVLRLAKLLPQYGFRVSILTFFIHPENQSFKPSCPFYLLPLTRTYNLEAFKAAFQLRRFLREQNVKIVQTFFESSDLWAGGIAKMTSDAKLVWSRRDMGILRTRKHHVAYRMMAGVPDAVFAVSEQVRQYCIDVDRIEPSRVLTVHNGLDLGELNRVGNASSGHRGLNVLTVGNIRPVKGHDVLIRAGAQIVQRFPDAKIQIAGDVLEPEYYRELQRLVETLGLSGRVAFLGNVTDLKQCFAQADIFVLPSRSEGFSNAIVEAMAAALPVVATNVGGNAEAVKNGETGLIVPAEDESALADAICLLLGAPEQAAAMGVLGRARAADLFTTESMMRRIVDTYAKLLV